MARLASLVIPTRNRASVLARTLAALRHQRDRAFEVVIADDGSTDGTRDVCLRFQAELDLRYVRRAPVGIAAARNAAIRASKGDVLISCDDDRIPDPDYVADHLAAHAGETPVVACGVQKALAADWSREAAYTAADVAALCARHPALVARFGEPAAELVSEAMIRADLPAALAAFELADPYWEHHARPVLAHWPDLTGFAFPWTLGIGGNTSVPRALAEEVGLLDERFVGWGLEDADFHYRLHVAGARTVLMTGGANYHQVHRRGAERAWEWTRNALYFVDKHPALAIYLYVAVIRRRLSLVDANRIVREDAALGDAAPAVRAELLRLARENVRGLLAAGA